MEFYTKNITDTTYKSELTPPFLNLIGMNFRKGGVKFALITYVHLRSVSYVLI
jgi:hypothetical protein